MGVAEPKLKVCLAMDRSAWNHDCLNADVRSPNKPRIRTA
jgi:hypothetical protein